LTKIKAEINEIERHSSEGIEQKKESGKVNYTAMKI
jgi:hypothetical protein